MFDVSIAERMARACDLAYWADSEKVVKDLSVEQARVISMAGHGALVAESEAETIVAFRGSASIRDWIDDGQFYLASIPPYFGRVHVGFSRVLISLYAELSPYLQRGNVAITGHSLGAAVAVLASCSVPVLSKPLYLFGCPKVGDRQFADSYQHRVYRVINDLDPVCHAPFDWLYRHVGEEVWLPELGPRSLWGRLKRVCSQLLRGLPRTVMTAVEHHLISKYVDALSS